MLICPRLGFLAATFISPTRPAQSVYMEKAVMRENVNEDIRAKKMKILLEDLYTDRSRPLSVTGAVAEELDTRVQPLEAEAQLKLQNHFRKIDRRYQREKTQQEALGETLSRITPTSCLIYLVTNLTQTGKEKKRKYFQTGDRYYDALHSDLFSKIVDHISVRTTSSTDNKKILQPPVLSAATLAETFRASVVDVLLLCFFMAVSTSGAFLKFIHTDI